MLGTHIIFIFIFSRDPSFMRVVQQAKIHSAPSLTLSSDLQLRGQVPRKAINLAPVRDCRVAVKTINFPHAAPPKRQPTHIPQLQQQQQQTNTSQTPNLPDIPSAKVSFPWPVRIVVNSDTLKGNKLTSLTPPQSPSKSGRPLERSESVDRQLHAHYRISKRAITKKRSEGDIRQPLCSTATATDFSITDPNIYQQFLAQQRRFNKAAAAGNLFFSNNSQSNSGPSVKSDKKEDGKPPISLCEAYSSASLITAVNKGWYTCYSDKCAFFLFALMYRIFCCRVRNCTDISPSFHLHLMIVKTFCDFVVNVCIGVVLALASPSSPLYDNKNFEQIRSLFTFYTT